MTDSSLLRLMSAQSRRRVGLVPYGSVDSGAARTRAEMERLAELGVSYGVVDVLSDRHLATIGEAIADHPLVTDVTGRGLLVGIVLREPLAAEVQQVALKAGLIINNATPHRLRLAPPLILSEDQAAAAVTTLRGIFDEVSA
jgi:acetylornithine/succinyldiaminopimelate/putrescine aminotransferase